MSALGVVAFVVGLLVSVVLHEAGHLVTAKRSGMKVTEFFVGFGPRLFSWRRGETEYGMKALPAGGYCKISGMAQEEDIPEQDRHRAFYRKAGWKQAVVLASGSFTHFVIAFVLLFIMAIGLGLPQSSHPTRTVAQVMPCVPESATATCGEGRPPSPASQAGLRSGDRIVAVAGEPVHDWKQVSKAISAQGTGETSLAVLRHGHRKTLHVDLASLGGGGFLGIRPESHVVTARLGPADSAVYAGQHFGTFMVKTAQAFAAIPAAIPTLFSSDRGQAVSGGAHVSSIVGVAQTTGSIFGLERPWSLKVLSFLGIMVVVNISIGMLNLLPLMPLDGGRLALLGFERSRSGLARLFGRRDPGPVDLNKLLPVASVMLVVIIGFGVLLILADVLNPVGVS